MFYKFLPKVGFSGVLGLLESLAILITIAHIIFYADILSIASIAIASFLFSIAISVILSSQPHAFLSNKYTKKSVFFFAIYLLLMVWLGAIKTMPEYADIRDFEKKRSDLIFNMTNLLVVAPHNRIEFISLADFAKLYLHAKPAVNKVEYNVNHKGAMMMAEFLNYKIRKGEGIRFSGDMYELAEVGFHSTGKVFAKNWYEKAFENGKEDALERFNKRILNVEN